MSNPSVGNTQGGPAHVPQVPGQPQPTVPMFTVEPEKLLGFIPSYDGDAFTIYNYLNGARQWLNLVGGNTPQNVMLLLGKLRGRAAIIISMLDHGFNWVNIEKALKDECGDNRECNTLLVELSNVKKKSSYKELIFELKQKIFFIRSKLMDKYNNKELVDEVMEPYINTAQNTLRNSLPYHDQVYVSNCSFNDTVNKVLQLEAEGRFDNIRQKFSSVLPSPRVNNHNVPHISQKPFIQNVPINPYNFASNSAQFRGNNNNNYPQRFPQKQNSIPYHSRNPWIPNPNNVFARPQHKYFEQHRNAPRPNQNHTNVHNPLQSEDVSMRTVPQLRPGQINLGKGKIAEELFYHDPNVPDLQNYSDYDYDCNLAQSYYDNDRQYSYLNHDLQSSHYNHDLQSSYYAREQETYDHDVKEQNFSQPPDLDEKL